MRGAPIPVTFEYRPRIVVSASVRALDDDVTVDLDGGLCEPSGCGPIVAAIVVALLVVAAGLAVSSLVLP